MYLVPTIRELSTSRKRKPATVLSWIFRKCLQEFIEMTEPQKRETCLAKFGY